MRHIVGVVAALGALFAITVARADDGDAVRVPRGPIHIGEQLTITLEVATPRGAAVELDPASPAWNGVEIIRIAGQRSRDEGDRTIHTLDVVVAPFVPGDLPFQPAVTVVADNEATPRLLPQGTVSVLSVLGLDDPLELSRLAPPESISGAESPWLRPAIAGGAGTAVLLVLGGTLLMARALRARGRRALPAEEQPVVGPGLGGAEELLEHDPVTAYRRLAAAVRAILADRYGFPASALTTLELRGRMESEGVDRWQARLVSGLLEECDAVVYAGYRPAMERRRADLTMAREIAEEPA